MNEAFIIDQATRDRLVKEDSASTAIIKPMLRGEDLRPWYQEHEGRWLIFTRRGIDIKKYPAILTYLQQYRSQLEPRPNNWDNSLHWPGRKPGSYKWYEIQDSIEYYEAFEKQNVFYSDIAMFPRFSWGSQGYYVNNRGYVLTTKDISLLGILQSRASWFCITRLCAPLGERKGLVRYLHFTQYMTTLPIPNLTNTQCETIGRLAQQITEKAKQRYELRQKMTHRIENDLGNAQMKLNQRLNTWWVLTFRVFQAEIKNVFKHDIPLKDRDDWETLLHERTIEIKRLTEEIVRLETELNAAVYEAFGLDEAEIALIEQETKYQYGEW